MYAARHDLDIRTQLRVFGFPLSEKTTERYDDVRGAGIRIGVGEAWRTKNLQVEICNGLSFNDFPGTKYEKPLSLQRVWPYSRVAVGVFF